MWKSLFSDVQCVERLMGIYQRMLGAPLNTLDAVASGAKAVPIRLDYVAPPPVPAAPIEIASARAAAGGR